MQDSTSLYDSLYIVLCIIKVGLKQLLRSVLYAAVITYGDSYVSLNKWCRLDAFISLVTNEAISYPGRHT